MAAFDQMCILGNKSLSRSNLPSGSLPAEKASPEIASGANKICWQKLHSRPGIALFLHNRPTDTIFGSTLPTGCATRLKGENVAPSSPGLASTHRIERRPLSTAQGCKDVTGSIIQRAKCHNARIYVAADRNTNILELNRQPFFRRRISPQKQL